MKTPTSLILLAGVSAADYTCPAMPSMSDSISLQYAYQVQQLLNMYYQSVPVNDSFFSSLPMAQIQTSNGMTLAENTVTNVEGLGKQAMLASQALMQEIGMVQGASIVPMCDYMLPLAPNASAHLMNAFNLEATLCGAFIGLADYFQSPTLNSLSARIAAEHGIHAAAIRAMMQPVGFMPNSTMLTPAFTPGMVLSTGMEVGQLGAYLGTCEIQSPPAPCGGTVSFGPLLSYLSGQSGSEGSAPGAMSSSAPTSIPMSTPGETYASATMTTAAPATYTGEGNKLTAGAGVAVAALAMGWMLA